MPEPAIPERSLGEFVLDHAAHRPDRPALIDGVTGQVITYASFAARVRAAAAGLAACGFRQGDVLALLCANTPGYAVALHAALLLGGVVTPANPLFTPGELLTQLCDSGARWIVASPPSEATALAARAQGAVDEVFVIGGAGGAGTPFEALLEAGGPLPHVQIDSGSTAVLPYSSGTTGLPKGVRLTHRNLVANLVQLAAVEPITPGDVLLGVLPFFHIYGLTFVLNLGLVTGAAVVTMPRFDLAACLDLMRRYQVTRAPLVPPVIRALARHPAARGVELPALRVIISGAAPLAGDIAAECAARLGCVVKQGYGLTETSPVTHINPDDAVRPGSVGPPLPGTECRIVDPATGVVLPPGEAGEVCICGPQVMAGYLGQPEATAAVLDAEGWLRTGDIGRLDAAGYLTIVDRLKEQIKYKGFQVAPAELEALLLRHPAVAAAAVVPAPDEEAGEVPKAFIVAAEPVAAGEIMSFVAERVAPHKRIRRVEFVEEIPVSASGKILRRVLVERERAGRAG
ncbi:MAG TPA: AMP-binding protein [Aggregatilineales bacterium]|nr:AMP-binding protein [Aggregatilineales bacterium]